jgi:fatty acid desaturase
MSVTRRLTRGEAFAIFALLILGAGFVGMVAGFQYFFVIWVLGYAVVLPILAMLFGETDTDSKWDWHWNRNRERTTEGATQTTDDDQRTESSADALTTLRDRYARGDLTDEAFEHKLDRLLETESSETAAEWRELTTEKAK